MSKVIYFGGTGFHHHLHISSNLQTSDLVSQCPQNYAPYAWKMKLSTHVQLVILKLAR